MIYYAGVFIGLHILFMLIGDERESKTMLVSLLIYLPIYGRIFGWW